MGDVLIYISLDVVNRVKKHNCRQPQLIEIVGRGRGTNYLLSRRFYYYNAINDSNNKELCF